MKIVFFFISGNNKLKLIHAKKIIAFFYTYSSTLYIKGSNINNNYQYCFNKNLHKTSFQGKRNYMPLMMKGSVHWFDSTAKKRNLGTYYKKA